MASNSHKMDLTDGNILLKMIQFALPLMTSSVLQLLFNAADIVVVGKYAGDHALAAVGSNGSLINLLTNLFIGLSIGSNVLVSMYYGGRNEKNASEAVHTSMVVSVLSGLILTLIGVMFSPQILRLMDVPEEVFPLSVLYMRIYFLGMTAMMVYNFGAAILRAVGDTKRPLYFLTAAGIINVILNLIFVIALRMSVAGVALATVISQFVSAFLIVACLMREEGMIRLELKKLRIHKDKLIGIIRIGLPASVQGVLFSVSNVLIQTSINGFNATVLAGNSAAMNIEGFVFVAMNAFYQANLSFTSQNVGAGKLNRVNRILLTALACAAVVGLVLGNLVIFFGRNLLGLYTNNPEVIDAGIVRLSIISRFYFVCGCMDTMVGSMRGLGHAILPTIMSLIGACVLRLIFIFTLFQTPRFHQIQYLYMTYPVTWTLTLIAHIICYIIVFRSVKRKMQESRMNFL